VCRARGFVSVEGEGGRGGGVDFRIDYQQVT
jgi:hypothetical protein